MGPTFQPLVFVWDAEFLETLGQQVRLCDGNRVIDGTVQDERRRGLLRQVDDRRRLAVLCLGLVVFPATHEIDHRACTLGLIGRQIHGPVEIDHRLHGAARACVTAVTLQGFHPP